MTAARTLPRPIDVIVAVATALLQLLILLAFGAGLSGSEGGEDAAVPGTAGWWLVAATIVVQGGLLLFARRAPALAAVGTAAAALALSAAAPGPVFDAVVPAVAVGVFRLFHQRARLRIVTGAIAAVLLFAAVVLNATLAEGSTVLEALLEGGAQVVGLVVLPLLLAAVLRARQDARDAREREIRALTGERDALVAAAVARERTAMARELHDIAAHHLSGIALMSSAISRQIDRDPAAARASADAIRAESTAVLQNLRRVVGLLREEGQTTRSVEDIAAIPELVAQAAATRGDRVHLTVLSEDDAQVGIGIGPLAQRAAYRTVQEALANAARHAPDAVCEVEVDDRAADALTVRVTNGARGRAAGEQAPGFGLVGMRERAELIGADLDAGPVGAAQWEVRLRIPREAPAGASAPRESRP